MRYSVIVNMNGVIVGSPDGIPCDTFALACKIAKVYRDRGPEFKLTKAVSEVKEIKMPDEISNQDLIKIKMFFGLSIPTGGQVSPGDWHSFEKNILGQSFEGFNVVDSFGYYKGVKERSKIVTVVIPESDKRKVDLVAETYCQVYKQDSVMVLVIPVESCEFISYRHQTT